MQDGTLDANGDGKRNSGFTGKYAEHRSSEGGYKSRRKKKVMNIPNNP